MKLESFILWNLIDNEEYMRKCLPYIKKEYFNNNSHKQLFSLIENFILTYDVPPSQEALYIELSNREDLKENLYEEVKSAIDELTCDKKFKLDWLLDKTEKFCKERAIHNALLDSIDISENKPEERGKIPEIMTDALAVSFDTSIGHNYMDDWEARWEAYTRVEKRIPFSLDMFNKITNGGLKKKTLSVFMAGTGGGKSRLMCHEAANHLLKGFNVLYITMEMSEEGIGERIDANLLDIPINELQSMDKEFFEKRIQRIKTIGKLIIKEYPTAAASVVNFRHLLTELKIKQSFEPDIIYVDYINICTSSRLSRNRTTSYEYVKAVAEELRGLAIQVEVPIITATQVNRTGFISSDIGLEDTSESFGLPATADLMLAIINTDELKELNQQMVKQLKNRLGDPNRNTRFVIGVDNEHMRYYDVEENAQTNILDGPVMDQTPTGQAFDKSKFDGFF